MKVNLLPPSDESTRKRGGEKGRERTLRAFCDRALARCTVNQMSKGVRAILEDISRQRGRAEPLAEQIITPEEAEEGKRQAQPFHRRDW